MATLAEKIKADNAKREKAKQESRGLLGGLRNAGRVISEGLLSPNEYNAPAANRFKDSAFGLLGIVPGVGDAASAAESADLFNRGENMAGSFAALGALPLVPSLAGMFVGKGAKTWDVLKAQQAEEMLAKGADPREVWKQTGTMRGVDKALRQEIPDNISHRVNPMKENKPAGWVPQNIGEYAKTPSIDAYPDLANLKIDTDSVYGIDPFGSVKGAYANDTIYMQPTGDSSYTTAIHEIQHAIQQREGWARGGSPGAMAGFNNPQIREIENKISSLLSGGWNKGVGEEIKTLNGQIAKIREVDPYEAYRRLAGEAEARLTQSRMGMNMDERLASYPMDMMDVPPEQQIVRGLLDGPAMSADASGLLGKVDNAPMSEQKLMRLYHGGTVKDKFDPENKLNWFAENKDFADKFSEYRKGTTQTFDVPLSNPFDATRYGDNEFPLSVWISLLEENGVDTSKIKLNDWAPEYGAYTFYDLFPHAGNNYKESDGLIQALSDAGFDGIKNNELTDEISSVVYATFGDNGIKPTLK